MIQFHLCPEGLILRPNVNVKKNGACEWGPDFELATSKFTLVEPGGSYEMTETISLNFKLNCRGIVLRVW